MHYKLQLMLDALSNWIIKWNININKKKSKYIYFRPKNNNKTDYIFKIENTVIDNTVWYKYLGVYFNELLDYGTNTKKQLVEL